MGWYGEGGCDSGDKAEIILGFNDPYPCPPPSNHCVSFDYELLYG